MEINIQSLDISEILLLFWCMEFWPGFSLGIWKIIWAEYKIILDHIIMELEKLNHFSLLYEKN